jgi:glutathione S-transferase
MRVSWDVVTESPIRLYGIALSHPVVGVQGMLERKGLAYRYVELLSGAHPLALFALRFARPTVPAMRLSDGRRVRGSLAIAKALEELVPARPSTRVSLRLALLPRRPSAGAKPCCNRCHVA